MKHPVAIPFLFVLLLLGCASTKKVVNQPKINIAVLGFEARTGVRPAEAQSVRDLFISLLQQTGRSNVLDRRQATMTERGFQGSQNGDADKTGKILGVRKMLFGSLGKIGKSVYVFSVKMTDVESANIELAITKNYSENLEDIGAEFLPGIISQIVQAIDAKTK
jgi:TolB-like protein